MNETDTAEPTRYCRKCGDHIERVSIQGPGFTVAGVWGNRIATRDILGQPYVIYLAQCQGPEDRHEPRPLRSTTTGSPGGGATSAEPSTAEPVEKS